MWLVIWWGKTETFGQLVFCGNCDGMTQIKWNMCALSSHATVTNLKLGQRHSPPLLHRVQMIFIFIPIFMPSFILASWKFSTNHNLFFKNCNLFLMHILLSHTHTHTFNNSQLTYPYLSCEVIDYYKQWPHRTNKKESNIRSRISWHEKVRVKGQVPRCLPPSPPLVLVVSSRP